MENLPKNIKDRIDQIIDAFEQNNVPHDKEAMVATLLFGAMLLKKYGTDDEQVQTMKLLANFLEIEAPVGRPRRHVKFPGFGSMIEERTSMDDARPKLEILLDCPVCPNPTKGLALIGAAPDKPLEEGTPCLCLSGKHLLVVENRQLREAILGDQPSKVLEAAHLMLGAI